MTQDRPAAPQVHLYAQTKCALNNIGESGIGLWNEEDELYYDVLTFPDGGRVPLTVRPLWNERKRNILARVCLFKKGA
jgi:hypothetical protein